MPVRLLLDENLPERLRLVFDPPIQAITVSFQGWKGKRNGELLEEAQSAGFDVFLTVDRGIPEEQEISRLALGIVLLECRTNRYSDLALHREEIAGAVRRAQPGSLIRLRL